MAKSDYSFVVTVRFPEDKRDTIHRAARLGGMNLSTFLRRAVFKEMARMKLLPKDEAVAYKEG